MAYEIPGNPGTIRGALTGLKINGKFVDCETSCDFNFDRDMIPVSPYSAGGWKHFKPGLRGWKMNVNGNLLLRSIGITDIKTVLDAVLTGEEMEVEFRTRGDIAPYLSISGNALPMSGGINGPNKGKATWTVTFQGTGPFTTDYEAFYLLINSMPIEADYPLIINTDTE